MDQQLASIFVNASSLLLIGGMTAALLFLGIGLREIRSGLLEGLLYLGVAAFFAASHFYYLWNIPEGSRFAATVAHLDLWDWVTIMFVPALITMFLARSLVDLVKLQRRPALTRMFFGLTLLCFVYMVGATWPTDAKAIVAVFYGFTWLDLEKSDH
ncbi:MAG: hypothetical protein OEV49_10110 [candidate division Zixibacteria bacterium]|nr:hypothetical protein [candidate division Zixibacteria bacterium]MDH3937539.1 hypothetical protein [candidate division Zixibacteria bacterium]MDH4034790.1 hypothetical protein [candidate division Zixibacteria bacterium]